MVSFEDFAKIELKIGKIIEAQDHPKADNLYVLKVDVGDKVIQLVAGIRRYYSIEELLGKEIVVVVNLEPKVIRGIESQGMLLAVQDKERVVLLIPEKEVSLGSIIK